MLVPESIWPLTTDSILVTESKITKCVGNSTDKYKFMKLEVKSYQFVDDNIFSYYFCCRIVKSVKQNRIQ